MKNNLFADRLVEARAARGFSQTDVAQAAGIAPGQVSRYEQGKNTPRPHILAKLAGVLAVSHSWLATGVGERDTAPQSRTDSEQHIKVASTRQTDNGYEFIFEVDQSTAQAIEAAAQKQGVEPGTYLKRLVFEQISRNIAANPKLSTSEIQAIASEVKRLIEADKT